MGAHCFGTAEHRGPAAAKLEITPCCLGSVTAEHLLRASGGGEGWDERQHALLASAVLLHVAGLGDDFDAKCRVLAAAGLRRRLSQKLRPAVIRPRP